MNRTRRIFLLILVITILIVTGPRFVSWVINTKTVVLMPPIVTREKIVEVPVEIPVRVPVTVTKVVTEVQLVTVTVDIDTGEVVEVTDDMSLIDSETAEISSDSASSDNGIYGLILLAIVFGLFTLLIFVMEGA